MSPEVQRLAAQCIIDYLGGHKERFEELVDKAMILQGELKCTCGKLMVPCRYGKKHYKIHGYLCTSCGKIVDKHVYKAC
jgi:hypothetical protein